MYDFSLRMPTFTGAFGTTRAGTSQCQFSTDTMVTTSHAAASLRCATALPAIRRTKCTSITHLPRFFSNVLEALFDVKLLPLQLVRLVDRVH